MNQNGPILDQEWFLFMATGDKLTQGSELGNRMCRLDFLLIMFPTKNNFQNVSLTNYNLS